jgi:hypothetical protein
MMNKPDLLLLLVAAMLVAGGCAEMRWTKQGADAAAVSRDLDECRASSLARAGPRGAAIPSQDPQMIDRGASPMATRPPGTSNERFIAEHEDVRVCMVRRGYQLQPAS